VEIRSVQVPQKFVMFRYLRNSQCSGISEICNVQVHEKFVMFRYIRNS